MDPQKYLSLAGSLRYGQVSSRKRLLLYLVLLIAGILIFSFIASATTIAQARTAYIRQIGAIETKELGLPPPIGLAFSPAANAFLTINLATTPQAEGAAASISAVTFFEEVAGIEPVTTLFSSPINVAFDNQSNSLFFLEPASDQLTAMAAGADGLPDPTATTRVEAGRFGLQAPGGMTFDPASGRLFILDRAVPRMVRIDPASAPGLNRATALRDGQIAEVDLEEIGLAAADAIAFNPGDGHLYLLNPAEQALVELTTTGQFVASRDLSPFNLVAPEGMVFAPSRDQTDDDAQMSLYLADSGRGGRIVEFSLTAPPALAGSASSLAATLVRTIKTSQFSPPSPDPSGLAYLVPANTLLISDGEVNEMPIFTGDNVFEATLSGNLLNTFSTTNFSNEPAGLAFNANNGHLFFSDDDQKRIFEVNQGADGFYGTADDIVTSFRTPPFNSGDPEGLAFAAGQNALYIVDGTNSEVYRVTPGANGMFDGVPSAGDDQVTHFDTAGLGITDPEGIEFNPDNGHLYLVGEPGNVVAEVTTAGELVQMISIAAANPHTPAGLAYGPGSVDPGAKSLYVADRRVDNNDDPNENDGKVYEFLLTLPATPTSTQTPTATATNTPLSSPTPTSTSSPIPGEEGTVIFLPFVIR